MKILIIILAVLFDFSANLTIPDSQVILWRQEISADQSSSRDVLIRLEAILVNGTRLRLPKWIVTRIYSPLHRAHLCLRVQMKLNHLIRANLPTDYLVYTGFGDTLGPERVRPGLRVVKERD